MKNIKKKTVLFSCIIFITIILFQSSMSLASTERILYQRREVKANPLMFSAVSKMTLQGDLIYDSSGTGSEKYGMYLYTKMDPIWDIGWMVSAVRAHIYVMVLTEKEHYSESGCWVDRYWGPPVHGLFTFTGDSDDYIFKDLGTYEWEWSAKIEGSTDHFKMEVQLNDGDAVGSTDIPNTNCHGIVEDYYRYMGYFQFKKEGCPPIFPIGLDTSAFLKFYVDNSLAKKYANGVSKYYFHAMTCEKYLAVSFKVKFDFYYYPVGRYLNLNEAVIANSHWHWIGDCEIPSGSEWCGTDNYYITFKPGNSPN